MAGSVNGDTVAEVRTMQASVRSWAARMAGSSTRGLRGMPSPVLLSLLCAAAFSPVLAAIGVGVGATALAGLAVFSSMGGGVLTELLASTLERVRAADERGESAHGDLEHEVAAGIERALAAGDGAAAELRAEIAVVLKRIDAGGEVLRAALAEDDDRIRRDMITTVAVLGSRFDEMAFLIQDVEQAAAEIQATLDEQSANVRVIIGQNDRQATDIRLIREGLAVILRRTDNDGPGGRALETGPRWMRGCPYRGLLPFEEKDADIFYGRERLTAELAVKVAGRVSSGGLIVVTGASGAGKSSLLRAGLLPGLAAGQQVAGSEYWPRIVMTPTQDPLGDLAAHLAAFSGGDPVAMRKTLTDSPGAAHLLAWSAILGEAARRRQAGPAARLVLIIDQFEQVFTLRPGPAGDEDRRAFITALAAASAHPVGDRQEPAAIVVIAVRGDFWDRCAAYPELAEALQDGQFVVGPMTESELRLAITGPADAAGLEIEPTLPDTILSDLRAIGGEGTVGALPLLSQAMALTWDSREGARLTSHGYGQAGGVSRAVEVSADRVFDALPAAEQDVAKDVLRGMTVAGRDGRVTRRPVTRADLYAAHDGAARSQIDAVLEAFAAERLIVLNGDTAQISHDALLSAWPRLRGWLEDDRASWIFYGQLSEDAAAWREGREDASFLYRGTHLAALREASVRWSANPGRFPALTGTERDFLHASQRAATRSARQRRIAIIALAILTLVAVTTSGLFLNQRSSIISERDAADLAAISANGLQLTGTDMALAAQVDLAAYRMQPDSAAFTARLIGIENTALSIPLAGETGAVDSVVAGQSGGLVASGGSGGAIVLWNMTDPADPRPIGQPLTERAAGGVNKLAISPDGRTIASADGAGVFLWDISDPARPQPLGLLPGSSGHSSLSVAFSRDGRTLAVGDALGMIRLWTVTSPRRPVLDDAPLRGSASGGVSAVAFSPDSATMAAGGEDGMLRLWSVADPRHAVMLGKPLAISAGDAIPSVAFSPNGRVLAVADLNNEALLLNAASPTRVTYIQTVVAGSPVYSVAFSPDGDVLATGSADGTVRVWNVTTPAFAQQLLSTLTGHASLVFGLAFTPDGHTLVTGSADGQVRVWSLPRTVLTGTSGPVYGVAFSPGGGVVASAGYDGLIQLWDVANPAAPQALGAPLVGSAKGAAVPTVAFSPDGRLLASGGLDNSVRLWNVTDPAAPRPAGPPLIVGTGAAARVYSVAFSPSSRILATGMGNDTSRLWDISNPAAPRPLDAVPDRWRRHRVGRCGAVEPGRSPACRRVRGRGSAVGRGRPGRRQRGRGPDDRPGGTGRRRSVQPGRALAGHQQPRRHHLAVEPGGSSVSAAYRPVLPKS